MEENKVNKEKKSKILVGLWDCPYCSAKGINGLRKICPNCGHPQDEGTKFYLGEEKEYLDEEKAAQYGKGADWTCSYCGALNRYDAKFCSACGGPREEASGDYFDNEKKQAEKEKRRQAEIDAVTAKPAPAEKPKKRKGLLAAIAIVLALIIGISIISALPSSKAASVTSKSWERYVATEVLKTVQRTDFTVPPDGRVLSSQEVIASYNTVIDHYEDVEVQKSRQVLDHYDTITEYKNNGDGTFTEINRQQPVYVTEFYTETERQPVYVQVPVFATAYTYEREEWVQGETLRSSGADDEPYWPAFTEDGTHRVSARQGLYRMILAGEKNRVYTADVPESIFTAYRVGDKAEATVTSGEITALDGKSID